MSFDLKLQNGSFLINNGQLEVVSEIDKLQQDVIKIISTEIGTVTLHQWYGTNLKADLIGSSSSRSSLKNEIVRTVFNALNNLKLIQEQNEKSGQILAPRECIGQIDSIECLDTTDIRQLIIFIAITTRSGIKMTESLPLFL